MPRCQRCGESNDPDAMYCWKCGALLPERQEYDGVYMLLTDFRVLSMWALRLIAYGIDFFIVSAFGFLITAFSYVPLMIGSLFGSNWTWRGVWAVPLYLGLAQIVYSVITEYVYSATFGKQIMGLKVETRDGKRPGLVSLFTRNLSKAYWVLLIFDFMAGVLTSRQPRDKYLDKISKTYVTDSGKGIRIPFLSRPRAYEAGRDIIPADLLPAFDPFTALNIGVFLMVVATIIINTPTGFTQLLGWIIVSVQEGLQRPPAGVTGMGYWFLISMGIWSIVSGVARYWFKVFPIKSVHDVFNGVFYLVFGLVLRLYMTDALEWVYLVYSLAIFCLVQVFLWAYYKRLKL